MREPFTRAVVFLVVLLIMLSGLGEESWGEPPKALGDLKLLHALRGEEALQAINRLHGKEVAGKDSYVGHYEKNGSVAMLYLSRTSSSSQAARQLKQMGERIEKGDTPFYHLKASKQGGITVYSALGQGQIHYFYRQDSDVIWLAADAPIAKQALADLFNRLKEGQQ